MDTLSPKLVRRMFIASSIMMVVAVALSVLNTAQVFSAPLRTTTGVPDTVGFEGFLAESDGDPIDSGDYVITFRVYDVPTGGSALWTEQHNAVQVTNGLYSTVLGAGTPFTTSTFNGTRYIGVTVGSGSEITPRTQVSSVPFALNADNTNRIGGGGVEGMVAAFDGACPSGWTEFVAAQGRVVVGVPASGDLGATVGIALSNTEDRTHTHTGPLHTHDQNMNGSSFSVNANGSGQQNSWATSANGSGITTHSGTVNSVTAYWVLTGVQAAGNGSTGTASTSQIIPYIQLRYCKLGS